MIPSQVGPAPTTKQPQPLGAPFTVAHGQAVLFSPHPGMMVQQTIPGCPRGLEIMAQSRQLIVQQKPPESTLLEDVLGEVTGFDKGLDSNNYTVITPSGQTVYWAAEQSGCCERNCCGRSRPFRMSVIDSQQSEVLSLDRPLRCACCCCFCCLQELEVSAGGVLLGTVTQDFSVLYPSFSVRGPDGDVRLGITGPSCGFKCCTDVDFPVMTADGHRQVGVLTKQWNGLAREVANDSKTFSIGFPHGADPATKATLFGAAMLLGYVYFGKDNIPQSEG